MAVRAAEHCTAEGAVAAAEGCHRKVEAVEKEKEAVDTLWGKATRKGQGKEETVEILSANPLRFSRTKHCQRESVSVRRIGASSSSASVSNASVRSPVRANVTSSKTEPDVVDGS